MESITKQETIEALKKLFDYEAHKENKEVIVSKDVDKTTFMINKMYLERFEVIDKLQTFFADKFISDGQVRIESMTMLYTVFHVEDR